MKITEELVGHIAHLARLELSPEERAGMAGELERIVDHMAALDGLDTAGVAPMSHVLPLKNVLRPDETAPSTGRALLLENAPAADGETFLAPKAME